ncbi:MAG: dTMP kinase [archaeon]
MGHNFPGVFICFEGIEGCGKSTQSELVEAELKKRGLSVVRSREPGGTQIGEMIRKILLDPKCNQMVGQTEVNLYAAARSQYVQELVVPHLREGGIFLTDRFLASSVAYQGGGRELGGEAVINANLTALLLPNLENRALDQLICPDATLVYDLPVEVGLGRAKKRGELDRLEQERIEFHTRVRDAYLKMCAQGPYHQNGYRPQGPVGLNTPFYLLDGTKSIEDLFKDTIKIVDAVLKRKN